jgi:hypothetical protein
MILYLEVNEITDNSSGLTNYVLGQEKCDYNVKNLTYYVTLRKSEVWQKKNPLSVVFFQFSGPCKAKQKEKITWNFGLPEQIGLKGVILVGWPWKRISSGRYERFFKFIYH